MITPNVRYHLISSPIISTIGNLALVYLQVGKERKEGGEPSSPTTRARTKDFNWENLAFEVINLQNLDAPFTIEEVWNAIRQMSSEKASGTDCFTGALSKKCWNII